MKGGDEEAEAGDGGGKGVQVHAGDGVEGALDEEDGLRARLGLLPAGEDAGKTAEQEVAGAAGGVRARDLKSSTNAVKGIVDAVKKTVDNPT